MEPAGSAFRVGVSLTRAQLVTAMTLPLLWATLLAAGEPQALRVAIDSQQPPWAFIPGASYDGLDPHKAPVLTPEQLNSVVGLDIDVMKALSRHLGVPLRPVSTSWFDTEAGLLAKRFDLIICSWTPNPKTPASIVATAPYHDWGLLVVVKAGNKKVTSFEDLAGQRIGHYRDPAVERSLQAIGRNGTLVPADDAEVLFAQLKAGRLDAVIFDSLYVRWRVAQDPSLRAVGEPLNRLGYHVGVRREDTELFRRVQDALAAMKAAGELHDIALRWEGGATK